MNKRIMAFLVSLVMVMSMLVTAVPAMAAPEQTVTLTVHADKAEANPGDTINFSVSIGAVNLLGGLDFYLRIPDGMTIVDSSITVPEGLVDTLDSDGDIGAPKAKNGYLWNYSAQSTGYTGTSDLVLVTFACTVDEDCAKEVKDVTIEVDVIFDNDELNEIPYIINKTTVEIKDKPVSVTGVTVNETLSLKTGESKDLTVVVTPDNATNKEVAYSITEGSEYITVDANGKVTGVKAGTATVKVTTADGNFSDTCTVTVACSHANKTNVAEQDSDCKTQGWDAYATCDACGQIYNEAGEEIAEIPYRPLSTQHTGGTATCTEKAVCTVCLNPYGETLEHDFISREVKPEALKTAGNCSEEAVYIMSCTKCHAVDTDTTNTFLGEKDPTNHADFGTYLDQPAEPDHKNGVDGYTGDKRCNGCKEILEPGQPIPAGSHVPADVWSSDSTDHWKECTVTGCGIVIDGTKAPHVSEKPENMAACEKQAVCDVCGVAYGEIPQHEFTKEEVKDAALKTAGDCGQEAVYIKSCITCGQVDTDTDNTFMGEKDADNHADYGTYLDQYAAADHKNGVDGYTGDERCNSCKQIIVPGEPIPAGEHVPADDWSTDDTDHWKECTVTDCGIVIEGTKAPHVSEKPENQATCMKEAVCDVCGVSYGSKLNHRFDYEDWKYDENSHWNECLTPGCEEKANENEHSCEAGEATCVQKLVCDTCGQEYGEFGDHKYGDEKPEVPAEIGKTGLKAHYQCSECQKYFVDVDHDTHVEKKEVEYEELIIPALVDEELTIEIPFSVIIEKTGDLDPTEETFSFEMFDLGYADAVYTVEGLTVETNGVNTYIGKLIIKVKESEFGNLSEGFKFAQIKGDSEGWTYDETVYYIAPQVTDTGIISFLIFPGDEGWGETTLEKVEFTNSYKKVQESTQPDDGEDDRPTEIPNTGDSNMWLLGMALLIGGFGVVIVTASSKKRFLVR